MDKGISPKIDKLIIIEARLINWIKGLGTLTVIGYQPI